MPSTQPRAEKPSLGSISQTVRRSEAADQNSLSSNLTSMGLPQDYGTMNTDSTDTKVTIPFPATTKQASAEINGQTTNAMSIGFADKILITITQGGRLAQWVTVPLLSDNPTQSDPFFATSRTPGGEDDTSLLPGVRFQPRTLLGAGSSEREMLGQLYASQLASMITTKRPEEQRSLLIGLGLAEADSDRDVFLQIVNLALGVI